MITLFNKFFRSSRETKWFLLNWAIYGIILIASTLYCYMRLDFVRSYKTPPASIEAPKH